MVMARFGLLGFGLLLVSCSLIGRGGSPDVPQDEARHRAALTTLTVNNQTDQKLTIGFRSATPPAQEVVLGTVNPLKAEKVAPLPAGEPIVLLARRADGKELLRVAQSYPIDGEFTWDIPAAAPFREP
jgi:hypothetical protein